MWWRGCGGGEDGERQEGECGRMGGVYGWMAEGGWRGREVYSTNVASIIYFLWCSKLRGPV